MTDAGDPTTPATPPPMGRFAGSGAPDDLQRPLDECLPIDEAPPTEAAGRESTQLRPAVPIDPATTMPAEVTTESTAPNHPHWWPIALVAHSRLVQTLHAIRLAPGRGVRAFRAWARRPTGRLVLPGLLIVTMLTTATLAGAMIIPTAGVSVAGEPMNTPHPNSGTASPGDTTPTVPPALPPGLPTEPGPAGSPQDTLVNWAADMADRTDIPTVALQAYGYAELVVGTTTPRCRLSWTTLAAIGRVESGHGSANDATLLPDGRVLPPIIGEPLDGQGGRQLILDTDRGELDRDTEYDRAVGPMQFIPSTWRLEAVDATGDGIADINNLHDAALAAANYLCRHDRDLSTPADWWAAIHSYNNVSVYAEAVFAAANEYGQRSRTG